MGGGGKRFVYTRRIGSPSDRVGAETEGNVGLTGKEDFCTRISVFWGAMRFFSATILKNIFLLHTLRSLPGGFPQIVLTPYHDEDTFSGGISATWPTDVPMPPSVTSELIPRFLAFLLRKSSAHSPPLVILFPITEYIVARGGQIFYYRIARFNKTVRG